MLHETPIKLPALPPQAGEGASLQHDEHATWQDVEYAIRLNDEYTERRIGNRRR